VTARRSLLVRAMPVPASARWSLLLVCVGAGVAAAVLR